METRHQLLARLDQTVTRLHGVYHNLPDPGILIYPEWTAKDVLGHLTFWHESFARNVRDQAQGIKPTPLKGKLMDLNLGGVDALRPYTLEQVLARFDVAHQIIQENIHNPILVLIPYRKGSRDYTPEEHLDLVNEHIQFHLKEVARHLCCDQNAK
jgi:hypothetical protein